MGERMNNFFDKINVYYRENPFVTYLGMELLAVDKGMAKLSMVATKDKHSNLLGVTHGGAIMSLADTAMGAACITNGKKTVTLEMNMNYIKAIQPETTVLAKATVLHNGSRTLVVEADIYDEAGTLYAKGRGTFFVVEKIDL